MTGSPLEAHALDADDLARLRDMERRVANGAGLKPGEARRLLAMLSAKDHALKFVREERDEAAAAARKWQSKAEIQKRMVETMDGNFALVVAERDAEKRRADVAEARLALEHADVAADRATTVVGYTEAMAEITVLEARLRELGEKP
jgi:tryptophan 2,3-dioxygenase